MNYNRPEQNRKAIDRRTEKRKTGDLGEDIACKFLMKQGYKIIERNYLKKYGEIDVIATHDCKCHFFEVKTVHNVIRETTDAYRPEDNVHSLKIKRLGRVIQAYLFSHRIFGREWQFNVITVYLNHKTRRARVCLLENIVL